MPNIIPSLSSWIINTAANVTKIDCNNKETRDDEDYLAMHPRRVHLYKNEANISTPASMTTRKVVRKVVKVIKKARPTSTEKHENTQKSPILNSRPTMPTQSTTQKRQPLTNPMNKNTEHNLAAIQYRVGTDS